MTAALAWGLALVAGGALPLVAGGAAAWSVGWVVGRLLAAGSGS